MSMIKALLSGDTCEKCRICCGFTKDDCWEIPLIFAEHRAKVEDLLGLKLAERGKEFVFDMRFDDGEVSYCPALSGNGCSLGALKPFDCAIWPFRVNALGGMLVITVSPVCAPVSHLPLSRITDFVHSDGFADKLFEEARRHPDIIKPYIDGYPIIAAARGGQ